MGFDLGFEKNNFLGNGIRTPPFTTLIIAFSPTSASKEVQQQLHFHTRPGRQPSGPPYLHSVYYIGQTSAEDLFIPTRSSVSEMNW